MTRIDLHTHAKLSKTFPFALRTVHQFIAQGRRLGLDGVALVEHLHAVHYWEIHDRMRREFRYEDAAGVYVGPDGFRMLSGAELTIAEGCDLIILAKVAQLTELDRSFAKPATRGYRPRFDEAIAGCRSVGAFVIGAHMYRPGKKLTKLGREQLAALDALELNGKDFSGDERVRNAARELNLPVVGGSDAHFWAQVGIKATVLPVDEITHASVTSAIRANRATVERQSYGPIAVRISRAYKRIRKARAAHAALTGGYNADATVGRDYSDRPGSRP